MPYDYDREEDYINTMSQKGWQLLKGGLFHHTYVQNDQRYCYKLDYNNRVNFSPEESYRYLSIFNEQGWEHVYATINGWHYFRKKYNPELPAEEYELYTDDTSLNEMLGRWSMIAKVLQIMFVTFVALNIALFFITREVTAIMNVIVEILAVCFLQVCIINLKAKKAFSKSNPTPIFYGGYALFGAFLLLLLLSMILLFIQN